jgi:hypothetical protein
MKQVPEYTVVAGRAKIKYEHLVDDNGVVYEIGLDGVYSPTSADCWGEYGVSLQEGHHIDEGAPCVCQCGSDVFQCFHHRYATDIRCIRCGNEVTKREW